MKKLKGKKIFSIDFWKGYNEKICSIACGKYRKFKTSKIYVKYQMEKLW